MLYLECWIHRKAGVHAAYHFVICIDTQSTRMHNVCWACRFGFKLRILFQNRFLEVEVDGPSFQHWILSPLCSVLIRPTIFLWHNNFALLHVVIEDEDFVFLFLRWLYSQLVQSGQPELNFIPISLFYLLEIRGTIRVELDVIAAASLGTAWFGLGFLFLISLLLCATMRRSR